MRCSTHEVHHRSGSPTHCRLLRIETPTSDFSFVLLDRRCNLIYTIEVAWIEDLENLEALINTFKVVLDKFGPQPFLPHERNQPKLLLSFPLSDSAQIDYEEVPITIDQEIDYEREMKALMLSYLKKQSINDSQTKCKLLDWYGSREIVAEGKWSSNDPTALVHHVPIGPHAIRVWVDVAKKPNAHLWRPT
ncbi:uncharacterized protein E5676_scaffold143G002920 [Cucumis melo var. makuwa]|uniref:Uncharacterized protein n=1 Tax=Cucumis melo var. makuwa TaxID=1194695 RepID=A0A5D3C0Z5_CUCMM|nr:uncharacterized protein E5676_scaffold143G002920 [Cucumis melo var. makuwa]